MIIAAIIFDLDGTVLEDEDEYSRAFKKVLKTFGVTATDAESHTKGIGVTENWPLLIKKFAIKTDKTPEVLAKETQDAYLLELTNISVRVGFEKFAHSLKDSGVKIGLATSNTWQVTNEILEKTNLTEVFDSITTREEVAFSKPDPALFILAADKLGAELEHCLVIEDSLAGINAARRAGMKVIGIAKDTHTEAELTGSNLVIRDFSEITPKVIDQL